MKPTFALIGLPTDRHSSYLRGPAKGPAFIRAALACDGNTIASEDGHELGRDLIINDCGDAPLHEADGDDEIIERSILAPQLVETALPFLDGYAKTKTWNEQVSESK